MQWLARRLQIFGVHVHVGVRSPEKAIPIVNALCQYLPHFLALSASCPYWIGARHRPRVGRTKVFEGLPTAGLPYQLVAAGTSSRRYMETLISTHAIESVREVWWDIRPHPDFGTVELRICDGLPTLDEIGAVAALAQCLVEQFDTPARPRLHAADAGGLGAAGEQVAGRAVRPRRRDRRRRAGHRPPGARRRSSTSSTTSRRPRAGSAARTSSPTSSRDPRARCVATSGSARSPPRTAATCGRSSTPAGRDAGAGCRR